MVKAIIICGVDSLTKISSAGCSGTAWINLRRLARR
jgi:hypothetical protein